MYATEHLHDRPGRRRRLTTAAAALGAVAGLLALPGPAGASEPAAAACGARWSVVPSPSPGTVHDNLLDVDAVAMDDVWAVGGTTSAPADTLAHRPLTLHWDGEAWADVPNPVTVDSHVTGVAALATDDVWAVGATLVGLQESRPLAMHWNGTAWRRVAAPRIDYANFIAVDGAASDDVWAVGTIRRGRARLLAAHWDGSAWTGVRLPEVDADFAILNDVVAVAPDDVWAVGYRLASATPQLVNEPLAAHFDGTRWRLVPVPQTGEEGSVLQSVTVTPAGEVWAVGTTTNAAGDQPLALRLVDGTWERPLPPPGPESARFYGVTATATGLLVAVGQDDEGFNQFRSLIESGQASGWTVNETPFAPGRDRLFGVAAVPGTNATWAVGETGVGRQPRTLILARCP